MQPIPPEPTRRERAEKADLRVASAEKGLRLLRGLFIAFIITLLVATTTFSAIAAFQAKSTAKVAANTAAASTAQTKANRATGQQNNLILRADNTILKQVSVVTSQHSNSINAIKALEKDLDHKFIVVVSATCKSEIQQHATQQAVASCEALLTKVKVTSP